MRKLRTLSLMTVSLLTLSSVPRAQAGGESYVALGDSYSAGTGTRAQVDDCYRSPYGYPALIAARARLSLDYQACSGAVTQDVVDHQLGTLDSSSAYVTMTIGGNDVGFSTVLKSCLQPAWLSDCDAALAGGREVLTTALPGRLEHLYGLIRHKAPQAQVSIGGYPHLFTGRECLGLPFLSAGEQQKLNAATNDLDQVVQTAAGRSGFHYVHPVAAFRGHATCEPGEWINGLTAPVRESFHPNRAGNQALAGLLGASLTGAAAPSVNPPLPEFSPGQRLRQAAAQVHALNLAAPAQLAKAKAAGLDPARVRGLNAQLSSPDPARVNAALAGLRALDRSVR